MADNNEGFKFVASNKPAAETPNNDAANAKASAAATEEQRKQNEDNRAARANKNNENDNNGEVGFGPDQVNPVTASADKIEGASVDTSEADEIREREPVNVYNPNTGLGKRVGGPFLDELELEEAERRRAIMEGREPDYTNMAGSAGVPLYTAGQMASALAGGRPEAADMIDANADNPNVGPNPIGKVNVAGNPDREVLRVKDEEEKARKEGNNEAITSHDTPGVVFAAPVENQGK
jgi:hypothetical protein